jgi:hypothetical protein
MAQLFGDQRCTAAILDFLRTMDVGQRTGKERREEVDEDDGEDHEGAWSECWEALGKGEDEGG